MTYVWNISGYSRVGLCSFRRVDRCRRMGGASSRACVSDRPRICYCVCQNRYMEQALRSHFRRNVGRRIILRVLASCNLGSRYFAQLTQLVISSAFRGTPQSPKTSQNPCFEPISGHRSHILCSICVLICPVHYQGSLKCLTTSRPYSPED